MVVDLSVTLMQAEFARGSKFRKDIVKYRTYSSDIVVGHSHGHSLEGFISKYMRENRKGEVMGHSPKEKQSLDIVI